MPNLEPKAVHRELEQNIFWPVYWIYGPEKYKQREVLKRIRNSVSVGWNEEVFDGASVDGRTVLDSLRTLTFGGGVRFVVVTEAHTIKNFEVLSGAFGPPRKREELEYVCVCLAKDLDGRKKFSKLLLENAAVIPCDDVSESQREAWILYLAQKRRLSLKSHLI